MTAMATHSSRTLGATTMLWFLTAAVGAIRTGTLLGLFPRLLQLHGTNGPLLVLLLHVAGALATLAAVFSRSRVGLLLAVLYTGYSTVVLALGAPTPALQTMTWIVGGLAFASVLACAASPKLATLKIRMAPGIALVVATVAMGVILLMILR